MELKTRQLLDTYHHLLVKTPQFFQDVFMRMMDLVCWFLVGVLMWLSFSQFEHVFGRYPKGMVINDLNYQAPVIAVLFYLSR